ncbi:ATP-binding protein [Cohnella fermenti]|uniref:histidine kinase n=1 Tax=Cohnella fermenti TaxID=2565925 RepID=A0A4S4C977_9BACL|nr:ATP-binding protein [Cohnella fermenti]THF84554.1 HAMP domain-containing protein [Cohnella fermenti]
MDWRIVRRRPRKTSILSYWTLRYIVILCVGFTIIALCALYWIRDTAKDNRLKTAGLLGQEIADRVSSEDGTLAIPPQMDQLLDSRLKVFNFKGDLCLIITDEAGRVEYSRPPMNEEMARSYLTDDLSASGKPNQQAVITPIEADGKPLGQVALLLSKKSLAYSPNELALIGVLLGTMILCGWLTIYLLSRKLSLPIRRVAEGARRIRSGQYDVSLDVETKERELDELVDSFKEMASRLKQLEDWRALSLAGVTHELKTPVTSIKGLMMAVRDEVVTEDEAKEFLGLALKESDRMERMVTDLLDYNAFAAGHVEVRRDRLELGGFLGEIVFQWGLPNAGEGAAVETELPDSPVYVVGDALRIQQIVVNLLNNGLQAASPARPARLTVRLLAGGGVDPQVDSRTRAGMGTGAGVRAGSGAEAEVGARSGAEAGVRARSEAEAEVRARSGPEAGVRARSGAEAGVRAGSEAEAEVGARSGAEARGRAGSGAKAGVRARSGAEAEVRARPEAEAGVRAGSGAEAGVRARSGAEAEVRARSEAEAGVRARSGAEAEVRARSEAEAGVRARSGAEAEVRARSEAEAGVRARSGAEAEVRARSEAEAGVRTGSGAKAGVRAGSDVGPQPSNVSSHSNALPSVAVPAGRVRIEIADNGCGIPTEERPYIFERFYRGEWKKRHMRGLGLGLTYSSLLATALGGELRLEESSPSGSTFVLELPGELPR